MKEKGFTLIELLAVIVILAIIALIATPIVLNIIKDAKEESQKRSAENYFTAVEQAILRRNLKEEFKPTICTVISQGLDCEGYDEPLKVEVDGEIPNNGTIYLSNGKVSNGTILNFDGYTKKTNNLAQENVKSVTDKTKTTGLVPIQEENGNIKPGSEFKIKVNDTSDWLTFFVLSNDGDYVNLIAEQNITPDGIFTSEPQDGDEWYVPPYNSYGNRYGPQTIYTYLSEATRQWTNIPIIESFDHLDEGNQGYSTYGYQSIGIVKDNNSGKYITTITPNSSKYGDPVKYVNMRTRLPSEIEITQNTDCKISSSSSFNGSCPIWIVNYLWSNSESEEHYNEANGKKNSIGTNHGYWLLSTISKSTNGVYCVLYKGKIKGAGNDSENYGARPVITILKSDLLRVMK